MTAKKETNAGKYPYQDLEDYAGSEVVQDEIDDLQAELHRIMSNWNIAEQQLREREQEVVQLRRELESIYNEQKQNAECQNYVDGER